MDRIRTLLLQRTHTVVMDADRVADAATRPHRDADVERFEDELAQLGYVLSLDLAMTLRRLPHQAIQELRAWIVESLRPSQVAPVRGDYRTRMLRHLASTPVQPCPWCGELKRVGALDPCGHLVCRTCWEGGRFSGCPICHHRVALDPFLAVPAAEASPRLGTLALLHLAFDLAATARERFARLLARTMPLTAEDRAEIEAVIDALGPRAIAWLPARIPVHETMAIALARLWLVSPDPAAVLAATASHIASATDVLRIAAVLMGGNAALAEPMKLRSIPRRLRRSLLAALDRVAIPEAAEDVVRRAKLWQRVGERLHPGELAVDLPNAALAFQIARGDRSQVRRWAAPVEDGLRRGDAIAALAQLEQRPEQLLRRADHLVRSAPSDAVPAILDGIARAAARAAPGTLLALAAHVARRGEPWSHRVLGAWLTEDHRAPLPADAIAKITGIVRAELVGRAARRRHFPRAVLDRALADVVLARRGSRLPLAPLHCDVPLRGECFDAGWRHVATIDPLQLDTTPPDAGWIVIVARGRGTLTVGSQSFALAPRSVPIAIERSGSAGPRSDAERRGVSIDPADRTILVLDRRVPPTGSYRAHLAHLAHDTAELAAAHARPTVWDVACIHAAARANVVYVRDRAGAITTYRRRDGEAPVARLNRLLAGSEHDGQVAAIPAVDAPTFDARGDLLAELI